MPAPSGNYRWVYLWQWPIRAMHWAAAVSVVVLAVTGFMIGKPWFITSGEASSHYYMGFARLTHFIAAGVLVATAFVRVYWLFAGNQFERLKALFPVRVRDWKNLYKMVKYYLMLDVEEARRTTWGTIRSSSCRTRGCTSWPPSWSTTGFAMYGQSNPNGFIWTLFHWVPNVVGGLQMVRVIHHVTHVGVPDLHPHPRLPRPARRTHGALGDDQLDRQRRTVRAEGRALRR